MKKISIACGYSLEFPAIRNRIEPIAKYAIDNSYSINLITSGTSKLNIKKNKINYIFCKIKNKLPINFIQRGLYEIFFSYILMIKSYSIRSDYLIISIPNIFNLIFCKKLKNGTKQILDIRDLSWEYLDEKYLLNKLVKKIFRLILKLKIKIFDAVSCSNNLEYKYLKKYSKVNNSKLILFSNGISLNKFNDLKLIKYNRTKQKKIIISYIGNIGLAQNLKTLLEASKNFPYLQFNIVGEGKDLKNLIKIAERQENIKFFGRKNWKNLLKVYEETNILYAQLSHNFLHAVPSKLYEYLASGKFIIYGGCGEASLVMNKFENNKVINPDNVEELIKAIKESLENENYKKISTFNREKIYSAYLREKCVSDLFNFIENN